MKKNVDDYIQQQKSPQRKICQRLRQIILQTFPDINEEMRVGVPCYGHTKKDLCGKYYIAALKDHVNLGFSLKGLTQKEQSFFEGSGKTMKHIKIYAAKDIDEERIITLLKLVKKK